MLSEKDQSDHPKKTRPDLSRAMSKEHSRRTLEYALWLLGRRAYSIKRIREKLEGKKFESEDIDAAIKRLIELKFLDDFEFAKNFIRQSALGKPKGVRRVRFELLHKGIENDVIEDALLEGNLAESEEELIKKALKTYIKKSTNLAREKIYNRSMGFLLRRGFGYDKSKRAVSEFLESHDNIC